MIAAIEGYCFGAGMQLALAADIRIATPNTQMSIMESRWGLVPDMGLTRSLKGLIGVDLAKELTLTARVFDAEYAKEIGLVTHLGQQSVGKGQCDCTGNAATFPRCHHGSETGTRCHGTPARKGTTFRKVMAA